MATVSASASASASVSAPVLASVSASTLRLIALHALDDHHVGTRHDVRQAWDANPSNAAPAHEGRAKAGVETTGILVMHPHPHPVGGVDESPARRRGPPLEAAAPRGAGHFESSSEGGSVEGLEAVGRELPTDPFLHCEVYTKVSAGGEQGAPDGSSALALAAPRGWKNRFR